MLLEIKPLGVFVPGNNLCGIGSAHFFNTLAGKQPLTLESTKYVGGAVQLDVLVAVPFMLLFICRILFSNANNLEVVGRGC